MSRFVSRVLLRHRPDGARVLRGGRLNDAGRLPRYALLFGLTAAALWVPIFAYVKLTPKTYSSEVSLILPGSGSQSSVNLVDLGQASSSAASAFSSSRVSPTQTYKRLLAANRTLEKAAAAVNIDRPDLGSPRIKLVDETSLIHFAMTGPTPEAAQARADAVLSVFLEELDLLREDELDHREAASRVAIAEYEKAITDLKDRIAEVQADSGLLSYDHYKDLVAKRDELAVRLEEARSAKRAADAEAEAFANRLQMDADAAAMNLRLHSDPEFQELAKAYSLHSTELAEARGRYGPRHPKVTSAAMSLTGAKSKMTDRGLEITGVDVVPVLSRMDLAPDPARTALLSDLVAQATLCEGLASALNSLKSQLNQADARLSRLAPMASRLDDLSRDYQVAEAVFASALARTDTSKTEVYGSYPLVQVLADASLPAKPVSPKQLIAIAAGVVATAMLLMAFVLGWMRRPLIDRLLARSDA